ncbi:hypothetical protein [Sphingomonas elodea]|nr:hypothetical protein [Sphingomonas elodea]
MPLPLVSGYAESEGVDGELPQRIEPFRKVVVADRLARRAPSP